MRPPIRAWMPDRIGVAVLLSLPLVVGLAATQPPAEQRQAMFDRAVSAFLSGRVAESVAGFDDLAARAPDLAPRLWQRGIALYYAGRFKDCRAQFESHRTVNPNDVENAAWHFLCVARAESPRWARSILLPVGPDARVPMRQIYEMFRGTLTPEQVLSAAGSSLEGQFYAHLYVGLYLEAQGDRGRAIEHLTAAAADRHGAVGGYMHRVAQIHVGLLQGGR